MEKDVFLTQGWSRKHGDKVREILLSTSFGIVKQNQTMLKIRAKIGGVS